jgi:hypothetical protein
LLGCSHVRWILNERYNEGMYSLVASGDSGLYPAKVDIKGFFCFPRNQHFDMSDLDEKIFAIPGVIDFRGSTDNLWEATQLNIEVVTVDQSDQVIESLLSKALDAVELIGQTRRDGKMKVIVKTMRCDGNLSIGAGKRKIMESI